MRISDWSSDVCSSDLDKHRHHRNDQTRSCTTRHNLSSFLFGESNDFTAAWLHRHEEADDSSQSSRPCSAVGRTSTPMCRRSSRSANSPPSAVEDRSEEHTSELQSLMRTSYAVFC